MINHVAILPATLVLTKEPRTMSDMPHYFYPNRMGRIVLKATEDVLGLLAYQRVLQAARLERFIGTPPPGDLELAFPFEYVAALQAAVEQVFGIDQGRALNQQLGRACLSSGLQSFNPLLGIADLPQRVMPLSLKLHIGFDMFAMVFNRFTDQVVKLSEESNHYLWIIQRCPVCWGRHTDKPACNYANGLLTASLKWVSGGHEFQVYQIAAKSCGDENCKLYVPKEPRSS
jgi:hypothetical protein